ncbi:hypothetical protein O181_054389 [Austropuccinia psidii MF-1]|uniref:Uncharacterized protein n=1 Tax=Austropuccinia psidii MF-1 TaxID=1389203 RepID=A0A9Q3HTM4_9BASI|nr:hypothetical protein [Austropuccinia psidii MF-1]
MPKNQPEVGGGLTRTRRPGGGHLGHSGGWKDIEGNHPYSAIHFSIQQKPQTRGLEGYRWFSSAPPKHQRPFSMEHEQQEVQPSIPLGRTWSRYVSKRWTSKTLCHDKGESRQYPGYRSTADPERAYSDSFSLTSSRPNQLSSSFKQFRNQQISGQESPFFTIPASFWEKTRREGQKQDLFSPKAERVRPNDPEAI